MIEDLGFNLNAAVSDFLDPFHNIVNVAYYVYLGEENNYGVITPKYAPPMTVPVQTQIPSATQAKLVRKEIDIRYARIFYVNAEITPAARIDQKGGDLIVHEGNVYYVEAINDDFRQVGWMSVIGVRTFENIPVTVEP